MGRSTALVMGTLTTVIAFISLAQPLLLEVLGPQALLATYAGAAVAAGATAYVLVRRTSAALTSRRDSVSESTTDDQSPESGVDDDLVERELQQLGEK